MSLAQGGRIVESAALLRGIADVARERGLLNAEIRAVNNLWATAQVDNQVQDFGELDKIIDKSGSINWQVRKDFFGSLTTFHTGDIEKALSMVEDGEGFDLSEFWESAFECNRFWFEQTRDGVDPVKHARILEIAEGYLENDDPQINESGEEIRAKAMFLHGDFESVVRLVLEGESEPFNYPSSFEEGIGSAGFTGDMEGARQLLSRLQAMNLKGRAISGLDQFANMVVAGLAGDVEPALVARARMSDFWSTTMPPLTRAHADAVTAAVLPFDHPEAVEAAGKAMNFFTSYGFQAYLDLYKDIFDRYREESEEVAV
jgi:hypothetical protein